MSATNAEFITALGLDPTKVTDEPLRLQVLSTEHVLVYYEGFLDIPMAALTAAAEATGATVHVGTRPPILPDGATQGDYMRPVQ